MECGPGQLSSIRATVWPPGVSAEGPTQAPRPWGADDGPGVEQALLRGQGTCCRGGQGLSERALAGCVGVFSAVEGQGVLPCPRLEVHAAWLSKKLLFLSSRLQEETVAARRARPQCPGSRLTCTACLAREAEARRVVRGSQAECPCADLRRGSAPSEVKAEGRF